MRRPYLRWVAMTLALLSFSIAAYLYGKIYYTEKEYATLKNPITTGYPDNPTVAITADKHLELYTTKRSDVKLSFGYIGEAKPNDNNEWPIPDKLHRAVIYYIAGLTLLTYKDAHADSLINIALQMIGAKTN